MKSLSRFGTFVLLACFQTSCGKSPEENQKAFFQAVEKGDVQAAQSSLTDGADVNLSSPGKGEPALFTAAKRGDRDMVRLLLQQGANPNISHANPNQGGNVVTVHLLAMIEARLDLMKRSAKNPKLSAFLQNSNIATDKDAIDKMAEVYDLLKNALKGKRDK